MDYNFMTLSKLWADYVPDAFAFDATASEESEKDGIVYKKTFFTSEKALDGDVRVACGITHKKDCNGHVVVYAGDLFKGGDKEMISRLAEAGYIVADIDFLRSEYPESLFYGKPDVSSPYYLYAKPSAKYTSWYVWAKMLKRAAVYMQSVYGSDKVILMAENKATTAAYMAAGSDKSFSALVTVSGGGYMSYDGMYKYGGETLVIDEERECFIAGIEAQTYAKFIDIPVLVLLSTNGALTDIDRGMDLFDIFAGQKTLVISPNLRDCITSAAAYNIPIWLGEALSGVPLKKNPSGEIVVSEYQYYFNVKTDDFDGIEAVTVYYSTTNTVPYYREWKKIKAEETVAGEYIAKLEIGEEAEILFAFADVHYTDGRNLSSKSVVKTPLDVIQKETNIKNRIIYSRETGINFVPLGLDSLIAGENLISQSPGAYGITGLTSKDGGMINYSIGSADTGGDAAALQADAYTTSDKSFVISIFKYGTDGTDGKYSCSVDLKAGDEWQRISLEPRMFKNDGLKYADSFECVKILEIENADGIIFNNILFV
ncbi:MAG: hypothetical protein LBT30_05635 [Clostridiales bacterium]|nr:hypothetical protein [Clostridiales bacterium]